MGEGKLLKQIYADNRDVIQGAKERWLNESHSATQEQRRIDYENIKGILSCEPATEDKPVALDDANTSAVDESAAKTDVFAKEYEAIEISHRNSMQSYATTARKVKIISGIVAVIILLVIGLSLST